VPGDLGIPLPFARCYRSSFLSESKCVLGARPPREVRGPLSPHHRDPPQGITRGDAQTMNPAKPTTTSIASLPAARQVGGFSLSLGSMSTPASMKRRTRLPGEEEEGAGPPQAANEVARADPSGGGGASEELARTGGDPSSPPKNGASVAALFRGGEVPLVPRGETPKSKPQEVGRIEKSSRRPKRRPSRRSPRPQREKPQLHRFARDGIGSTGNSLGFSGLLRTIGAPQKKQRHSSATTT